ncbi:MAG: 3-deoxy-manno-octulosonate cytidylyltransferase [bacterium]
MKILGVIPARYDSTRFPGKPLHMINGKSMIQRVYEQAGKCRELTTVIVATDHDLVEKHVNEFGGNVLMTSPDHRSGTERCAEALSVYLNSPGAEHIEIVVNIQGDEPFIHPEQISEVIHCFKTQSTQIATLARKISRVEELSDPNVVKLVFNLNKQVLYFSRSTIPFLRNVESREWIRHGEFYEHVGIYGFRTDILRQVVKLTETTLEKSESLEQLRWLQQGYPIMVHETAYESISIDTPADLLKITNKTR